MSSYRSAEETAHQLIAQLSEAHDDIDTLLACLLWSEWVPSIHWPDGSETGRMCGCCIPGSPRNEATGHMDHCPLDAILTKFGFDDQPKHSTKRYALAHAKRIRKALRGEA